jgi:archaellum component FlaC
MSVIEDVRQVVQDFVAPELRALSARLDAVEKQLDRVDKRFDNVDKRFDDVNKEFDDVYKKFDDVNKRFDDVERRAEQRHQELLRHMDQRLDDLGLLLRKALEVKDLADRVTALEGRTRQPAQ